MFVEKFFEEYLFYKEEGYLGFLDYIVFVSDFIEGGSVFFVVVIYLIYKKDNNEVWIRYFIFMSNFDRVDI